MENRNFSSEEIRTLRRSVRNINVEHKENLSRLEMAAVVVTQKVGSVGFFVIIALWSAVWILWNIFAPANLRFDPYPAFELWLFIANIIQLALLPLLMVGQNLLARHAQARADADFDLNKISEKEISFILEKLDEISRKLGDKN
ncbi:MAG: DUF1003 domain-containing protein [Candidatus Paceibacterota bacterium]|jgi:uncharacterized membrane protein